MKTLNMRLAALETMLPMARLKRAKKILTEIDLINDEIYRRRNL